MAEILGLGGGDAVWAERDRTSSAEESELSLLNGFNAAEIFISDLAVETMRGVCCLLLERFQPTAFARTYSSTHTKKKNKAAEERRLCCAE